MVAIPQLYFKSALLMDNGYKAVQLGATMRRDIVHLWQWIMDDRFRGAGTTRKKVAMLSCVCMTHSEEPNCDLMIRSLQLLLNSDLRAMAVKD